MSRVINRPCDKCGEKFRLTPENTHLFVYDRDHRCDHLMGFCTCCGQSFMVYVTATDIRTLAGLHLEVHYAEHADKDLRAKAHAAWKQYFANCSSFKKLRQELTAACDEEFFEELNKDS